MHRVLRLAVAQPQLLLDHARAYAELAAADFGEAASGVKRQSLLNAAGLCSLSVAAILAGVAVMLWAVTPLLPIHAPWALVVAPLLPAAVGLWCVLAARRGAGSVAFAELRRQLDADMAMLREGERT